MYRTLDALLENISVTYLGIDMTNYTKICATANGQLRTHTSKYCKSSVAHRLDDSWSLGARHEKCCRLHFNKSKPLTERHMVLPPGWPVYPGVRKHVLEYSQSLQS
jgi:hypothetical protein